MAQKPLQKGNATTQQCLLEKNSRGMHPGFSIATFKQPGYKDFDGEKGGKREGEIDHISDRVSLNDRVDRNMGGGREGEGDGQGG